MVDVSARPDQAARMLVLRFALELPPKSSAQKTLPKSFGLSAR